MGKSVALPIWLAPTPPWQVHTVPMPWAVAAECCLHARAQPEKAPMDFHQPHQHAQRNVGKSVALPSWLAPTTPWQVHTVPMPWTVAAECCLHARAQPEKAPMDFHQPHQHGQRNVGKSVALPSLLAPTPPWQVH